MYIYIYIYMTPPWNHIVPMIGIWNMIFSFPLYSSWRVCLHTVFYIADWVALTFQNMIPGGGPHLTHTYIHIYIYTYLNIHINIYVYIYIYMTPPWNHRPHLTHTYIHIYIYTYLNIHINIYVYVYIYKYIWPPPRTTSSMSTFSQSHMCVYVWIGIYKNMHICVHVHICIYTNKDFQK